VHTKVRRGAGAQQLGTQQGSQQLSGQSSTCQEASVQASEQMDLVDMAMAGGGAGVSWRRVSVWVSV
jgi:hypothetical protein